MAHRIIQSVAPGGTLGHCLWTLGARHGASQTQTFGWGGHNRHVLSAVIDLKCNMGSWPTVRAVVRRYTEQDVLKNKYHNNTKKWFQLSIRRILNGGRQRRSFYYSAGMVRKLWDREP